MKLRETLKNYGGFAVDVTTDEEIGDILVAIKYHDHGDEFLYVKTYSGEEYEYGYYLNRKDCWVNFDITKNSGESDRDFIRRPIMNVDMTSNKVVDASNKVFRDVNNDRLGMIDWMSCCSPRCVSKRFNADYILKKLIQDVNSVIESNVFCDFKKYKEIAEAFATLNELGEWAFELIDNTKWSNNEDTIGIAGKRKGFNRLYGDGLISVLYRGKNYDIKKVTYKREFVDEWGYPTYSLSTRQFQ
jgi:hypothetical protein